VLTKRVRRQNSTHPTVKTGIKWPIIGDIFGFTHGINYPIIDGYSKCSRSISVFVVGDTVECELKGTRMKAGKKYARKRK
jgi:hypothetical protein